MSAAGDLKADAGPKAIRFSTTPFSNTPARRGGWENPAVVGHDAAAKSSVATSELPFPRQRYVEG
jgi:hypothetical protein